MTEPENHCSKPRCYDPGFSFVDNVTEVDAFIKFDVRLAFEIIDGASKLARRG